MSKVNFVSEFNLFMRYARDNSLSLRERMLWIALFYIANDRATFNEQTQDYDWPDGFIQVSNGELNLYCCLDKRAIEMLRNGLKQRGIIDFQPGLKNKRNPAYKINYLSINVGYKKVPNDIPNNTPNSVPNNDTNGVPNNGANSIPNHTPTLTENDGILGANLRPTMPPYTQNIDINNTQNKYKQGSSVNPDQKTYRSDRNGRFNQPSAGSGFLDLDNEPGFGDFVPLQCGEGCM